MLGYEYQGYFAKGKEGAKLPFDYRNLKARRISRNDYLAGYNDKKRTTAIETLNCLVTAEEFNSRVDDYLVWLEGETKHRRVVAVEVDYLNDLADEKYMRLELE